MAHSWLKALMWCFALYLGGELLMGFQDVAFLHSRASFSITFLKIVVEVKAPGPPHILQLWLGVSKGMLPVKYFRSNKTSFYAS